MSLDEAQKFEREQFGILCETENKKEGVSAFLGAEGTGDLLFDLYHSDIAFSQVIIKRYLKIIDKGQYLRLTFVQPFN